MSRHAERERDGESSLPYKSYSEIDPVRTDGVNELNNSNNRRSLLNERRISSSVCLNESRTAANPIWYNSLEMRGAKVQQRGRDRENLDNEMLLKAFSGVPKLMSNLASRGNQSDVCHRGRRK